MAKAPKSLPSAERERLTALYAASGGLALANALSRLADRGHDISLFPFRLYDRLLWDTDLPRWGDLAHVATVLPEAQRPLFTALAVALEAGPAALFDLERDPGLPAQTRWEAQCWRVALSHLVTELPSKGRAVARVIQFWDKGKRPEEIETGFETWALVAEAHKAFTDRNAARFIARVAGEDAANTYESLWHPALKSDLLRLYALYERGGLYVDADSLPKDGIETFLTHGGGAVYASAVTDRPNAATVNGFLAAPPKSPLIAGFLEQVLATLHAGRIRNIYWLAGPGALTRYLAAQEDPQIRIFPSGLLKRDLFQQFDAPYKASPKNWRRYEAKEGLSDDDILPTLFHETATPA